MDLKQPVSRAWPFRLFTAGCVVWATSTELFSVGRLVEEQTLVLLLVLALLWPLLGGWCRRYDRPVTALSLHLVECALFGVLAAGLPQRSGLILQLLLLAGPAAVGGWRFLLPCLLVAAVSWDHAGLQQLIQADGPGLVLLFGFTLSLALVSFSQAQRLHGQRVQAVNVSNRLGIANAHLERYLPQPVRDNVRNAAGSRQTPDSCWVVVVFIDLVGFSAFVRHRTAAEVADVVDSYQTAVDRLASRHGGVLGKFLGDGVLVYFPEATDRNADAVRSLNMLADLPDLLEHLNRGWRQRGQLVTLQTRVGVASGYCALGDWGSDKRLDYTLIGDPVNLASRLQAAAEPGSALLCEATAALLEGSSMAREVLGPARCVTLKGFGELVVYPLVDAAGARL